MSPVRPTAKNRRRLRVGGSDDHAGGAGMERWLLTYSDMITLLMALFIVMWAVSAVNTSKYQALKASLAQAFGGKVLQQQRSPLSGQPAVLTGGRTPADQQGAAAAAAEQQALRQLQRQIDDYSRAHHLQSRLHAVIEERGLVVRLLTDDLLFDTGAAVLKPGALPVLRKVTTLLEQTVAGNDIRVEGNTDDVPISTPFYRSNWDLSAARAAAVLEQLAKDGIAFSRLSLAGYADQRPVSTNRTALGRSLNRRVDLVVVRKVVVGAGS